MIAGNSGTGLLAVELQCGAISFAWRVVVLGAFHVRRDLSGILTIPERILFEQERSVSFWAVYFLSLILSLLWLMLKSKYQTPTSA